MNLFRTCKKCGEVKSIRLFYDSRPGVKRHECMDCTHARRRACEEETERPIRQVPLDIPKLFKHGQNCWCCRRTTLPGKMLCRDCSTVQPVDGRRAVPKLRFPAGLLE